MTLRDIPYWRLSAFYFAYFLALGAYAPYFAPYLESRGLSAWQISVVMSLWFGSRVYAPSTWGWLTAHSAHPIRWLRAGAAVTLAAFALFLLPLGFAAVILVMLVYATAYNAIMPQFEALTLAHLGERRSRYGRIRVWGSVGFVIANIGFGWLLQGLGYHRLMALLLPQVPQFWLPLLKLPLSSMLGLLETAVSGRSSKSSTNSLSIPSLPSHTTT